MDAQQLFEQFRRTGEPALLGEVFDRCADDLFAVALHLARDRAAAEDLVQATFLVAIERAQRFQPGRPLQPWLLGILHREAKRQRRSSRRVPDAVRLARAPAVAAEHVVASAEVTRVAIAAIGEVPQPYRAVLELHLVETLPPAAIAERLQRSPGAVRTQLWRGLELLRKLLPKGLAIGIAAELSSQVPLAAVRERVMAAAGSKTAAVATAVGVGAIVGGLLMKKVLLAAAIVVALVLACTLPPFRSEVASVPPMLPAVPVVASDVGRVAAEQPVPSEALRTAVAPAADEAAKPVAPVPRAAITAQVLVVDGDGHAVVDAEVCVYARAHRTMENGDVKFGDQRQDPEPKLRLLTDANGRALVTVDESCLVSARKSRVGWSGDRLPPRDVVMGLGDWHIELLPTATVCGVVLLPDGSPAVGAKVTGYNSQSPKPMTGDLPPMRTDAAGRFEQQVIVGLDYSLLAQLDGRYADRDTVPELRPGQRFEITLHFPGAFSVRGTLVDAEQRPLSGQVRLVGTTPSINTDAEGRFEILLTHGGSFDIVGGVEGQTSAHAKLVLDETRPHQEVVLHTSPLVAVTGKVVDEHGAPCAGMSVGIYVPRDAPTDHQTDPYSTLQRGETAADGTFEFLTPAGYRYEVACQLVPGSRELWAASEPFTPPAHDVVVVVRDADKKGFVVLARVVADMDGVPVTNCIVSVNDVNQTMGMAAEGSMRIGPFAEGKQVSLRFEAEGFAPTIVGPWDSTAREESITVRMQRCGAVHCRVLRSDGTPAVQVWTTLAPEHGETYGRTKQGETDRDGCIEFSDVVPDSYKVQASTVPEYRALGSVPTVVRPEQTSEVLLQLHR